MAEVRVEARAKLTRSPWVTGVLRSSGCRLLDAVDSWGRLAAHG